MFSKLKRRIAERATSDYQMPFYEKFLIRPLAYPITNILLKTKIKPNEITYLSNVLLLIGALLIYDNNILYGSFCFLIYMILDCVDGEVAREKKMQSEKGALLEEILPSIFVILYFTMAFYKTLESHYALIYLGTSHFIHVLNEVKTTSNKSSEQPKTSSIIVGIKQFIGFLKSPFFMCLSFMFFVPEVVSIILLTFIVTFLYKLFLFCKS